MQRLRAKVEDVPSAPTLIRTVRGVGYRLDPCGVTGPTGTPAHLRPAAGDIPPLALTTSVTTGSCD